MAAAVVGTSIEMSHRTTGEWNSCISGCCKVRFNAVGALSNWQCVETDMVGKELALLAGWPSKATMVMVTLLAFPRRNAHRFSTGEFLGA